MNPADLFRQDSNTLQLAAGETLFRSGDAAAEMFVLLEGSMDIMVGNECVEASTIGALIGEMALIDNSPRNATVVGRTPCRLARIDQRRFHFLIQQNPFFATHVMKVLADRLRNMNQRLGPK
jgi:CRP/FNR family transcriptional regulator, cyclic AMP receptor protein